MIFKRSLLASSILSIISTLIISGCNDSSSSTVVDDNAYFDTTNPPKIAIELPPTNGPIATLNRVGEVSEPIQAQDGEAVVYYVAKSGTTRSNNFANYSLHIWNNEQCDRAANNMVNGSWDNTQNLPVGVDNLGPYWKINLKDGNTNCINFILRDDKLADPLGGDIRLDFTQIPDRTASYIAGDTKAKNSREEAFIVMSGVANAEAHLIGQNTLVWNGASGANQVRMYVSLKGGIQPNESYQYTADYLVLEPTELTAQQEIRFPYLAGQQAYTIPNDIDMRSIVKAENIVIAVDKQGTVLAGTKVQSAGVLDQLFAPKAQSEQLGSTVTNNGVQFKLWAPTAQNIVLVLFNDDKKELGRLQMDFDSQSGVWSTITDKAKDGTYYRYLVNVYHPVSGNVEQYQVTDPYSLSLAMNSKYSQVVNLNDSTLKPEGWDELVRPRDQSNPSSFVIYEAHVRDFSAHDQSTKEAYRGKFKAFTQHDSVPVNHLKKLSDNGVTHLHLLPVFDIATINEDPQQVANINQPFSSLCKVNAKVASSLFSGDCNNNLTIAEVLAREQNNDNEKSPKVQMLNQLISETDSFNWGYDPFHYTAPEGSYATNAEGKTRILEMREMVKAVKQDIKMNVVMDVVYNHTNSAGPISETSVLDKIVPWYYNRLNPITGAVENSTCCSNTAPEHAMMAKLIKDSLVVWSRDYKIDAFRFDLMGHHPLAQMKDALVAVQAVDSQTYFYGEGWNFGEVANDRLFIQATQPHLAGTGIGSFSDRLRDAVRGGGPFDGGNALRENQGFGNGAYVQPNKMSTTSKESALHSADLVRLGMAGNLKAFQFENAQGQRIRGDQLDYNGQPAGYAKDPTEIQNYVSKHDNQTLWDNQQYKIPYEVTANQRVRMQAVSLATAMLGQGVPFTHMGSEILRSKSMQRDSYDSGDWYNNVDFTLQDNNWNKGLPRKDKDGDNYTIIEQIIDGSGANAKPNNQEIQQMLDYYLDLANLRQRYPLITLGTGTEVIKRVAFHNTGTMQKPGLIVMTINNGKGMQDIDPTLDAMAIVINASPDSQSFDIGMTGLDLSDKYKSDLAKGAMVNGSVLTVPAWTPAVFVMPRGNVRSSGLPVLQ
ncbi:pullulanase-type alpha-1,6-glucosidase [Photobacterium piscicola]|uniref:pullulanase-type alpha-1,6-glucosidase n=1 Tax=Photobacterium piscicola TaxID=1378299 RepID=UPI002E18F735|nr:pullulanase-type alpha-1,6-glucosidase [Photobacterium piscicola]